MAPKRKTYIKNCTGNGCENEKKKSHRMLFRVIFYVLTACFAFAVVYMLFFSTQMQISNVEIQGTKELDRQEIINIVEQKLEGKYLNIFPKNNYIIFSKSSINRDLADRFKKIRSIEVRKNFPDSVIVNIDEHDSLLIWCRNDQDCYMLDEDGVAYSKADFDSPELQQNKLLQINDQSNSEVILGSQVIGQDYEEYILSIKNQFAQLGVNTENVLFTPSRMAEEVHVKSQEGYDMLLSTQFSLESSLKTLSAVLKKEIPKEKIAQLEYIDLRSEYKAFYKYKNSEENKDQENPENK